MFGGSGAGAIEKWVGKKPLAGEAGKGY